MNQNKAKPSRRKVAEPRATHIGEYAEYLADTYFSETSRVEPLTLTRKLHDSGKLLDIPILDHIIIGEPGRWTSLHRQGYLS